VKAASEADVHQKSQSQPLTPPGSAGAFMRSGQPFHEFGHSETLLRLAVNKFAVNLSSAFVHNQYFKILIVPQAVIAEVLRHFFTVLDCLRTCLELNANAVPIRDAVFHIEKELLHGILDCTFRDHRPLRIS
jgi:hypothetical protein